MVRSLRTRAIVAAAGTTVMGMAVEEEQEVAICPSVLELV